DGETYWLVDGFHRREAKERLGAKRVEVVVHEGTRDDAIRFACGANHANGLPRSNADKRLAVTSALGRWPDLSDRAVAEICKVGHPFVAKVRTETGGIGFHVRTGQDGKAYAPKKCGHCRKPGHN